MTVIPIGRRLPAALSGGKAAGLGDLIRAGLEVPPGWVVPGDAPVESVRDELAPMLDGRRYAVRSSAREEDSARRSYAGQFATVLGCSGVDEVIRAVAAVRGSRPEAYAAGDGDVPVVVQRMVDPIYSGVSFSRNPVTGLAEVVVEAVEGSSESILAGGATPERWTNRWGEFQAIPEGAVVDRSVIEEVIATTRRLEARHGPIDAEWAWDGSTLWWLQMRPITTADVPVYSNRISREVLPGLIHPLVWSVNIPVVNGAWIDLFTALIGPNRLEPDDLAKRFGCRAYFDMRAVGDVFEALGMPRDLLEVLMGLPGGDERPAFRPGPRVARHLPRMAVMAVRMARYEGELEREVPELEAAFQVMDDDLGGLDDEALAAAVSKLMELTRRAALANIVTPLLMSFTGRRYRKALEGEGIDPLTVDAASGLAALAEYDPAPAIEELADAFDCLDEPARAAVVAGDLSALPGLEEFLERFGHFSESGNDFSVPRWRDKPEVLINTLAARSSVDRNPARRPEHRSRRLVRLRDRAATWRVERERVSSLYTFGYGLFGPVFAEVGRRLAGRGSLTAPDDVWFLTRQEALDLLHGASWDPSPVVADRRREMEEAAGYTMPEVIFGDVFVPAPPPELGDAMRGLATSRGVHRGPARVLTRLEDGGTVRPGDVLVVPFSDVAWTSVFRTAGAVVAEAGGLLSHSSIIARELGIPCVVSVEGATRIPPGSMLIVDGDRGMVHVEGADVEG
jgi:phosphohistidine swiveling domain-containing protein